MKTLYKIGMLAVAALAFAGCSKEVNNTADQTAGTHTLTFTVQKDVDTRTAVVEGDGVASYVWTEGDDEYFHIYENGKEATEIVMELSEDNKIATFLATFANTDATEFTYTATYGSDLSNTGNPVNPSNQTPALNSFDPAADVLVSAEPITFEGSAKAAEDAEFQFKLKRVVSANKMTLKGLTVGERIYKVELTSDKYFSSRYSVGKDSYSGEAKTLVLDYEEIEAYAGADGTFPVYFISAPIEDATFSVRVVTDGVIYTRDDFTSKLTLAVGTFRRFGVNLSGYDQPIMSVTEYTKVESGDQIADGGEYLIVAEENSKAAGPYNNSKYYDAEDVVISNGKISIQTENASVFTLEAGEVAGQYYIKDQMGYYLKWASGNSVERSDVKYLWTVTTTGITSVETPDRRLQYNSGSPRFACYTSSLKAITLYVDESTLVELADPELSFDGEATINVNWADIAAFTSPALNNPHNVTVTYSSSNTDVATVDSATGEIEFVGNGTTTITASSAKTETYKAGSAYYQITVTGAPAEKGTEENPFTVAEALEIIAGLESGADNKTEEQYCVYGIVSKVISYSPAFNSLTYNISADGADGSNYIQVYSGKGLNGASFSSTSDLIVGDQVVVKGYLMKYNTTPEFYQNSRILSRIPAPHFTAEVTENSIAYTGGNSITLNVKANVAWTATIDNNATLKVGDSTAATTVSGNSDTSVTVIIPENVNGATYTISFSTTSDKVTAPNAITIIQNKEPDGDKVWTLVTDASTLAAGDIIVFAAYNVEYKASGVTYYDNKVMGSISNNLGTAIDVTFGTNGDTIDVLPASAKQYTLGGSSNRWTLFNGSKYIAWGDKKIVELDSPDNWTISFNGNNAIVTSVSASSYSLQYNPNSGNGRFATYSSSQKPIRIYRYE